MSFEYEALFPVSSLSLKNHFYSHGLLNTHTVRWLVTPYERLHSVVKGT